MTAASAPQPSIDELHKAASEFAAKDKAKAVAAATLAERLTQAYATRRLTVDVEGVRIPLRYPSQAERSALANALADVRALAEAIEKGAAPPEDEQLRIQRAVIDAAAAISQDASMNAEFFAASEYGVEIAARLLVAAEGALSARAGEARSFRRDS